MSVSGKRIPLLLSCAVLAFATFATAFQYNNQPVYAAAITDRSLTLSTGTTPSDVNGDGVNDGGSVAGATVNHEFAFTFPTTGDIGAIQFEYCTTADINIGGTCTTPTGLDTTGASLGAEDDNVNGFTLDTSTQGAPYLTRTAASATSEPVTFRLDDIVNPTAENTSFYVHITTHDVATPTNTIDSGTVTASTADEITLTGTMPESLIFCTGETIDVNSSDIPQCSTATAGDVSFNQLFSSESTTWATSQMAASTNAGSGYVITVSGPTLTSGANTIAAIGSTAASSAPGSSQFGLNLVDNSSDSTIGTGSSNPISYYNDGNAPASGDVYPAANGTNYKGQAATTAGGHPTEFGTAGSFAFATGSNNIVAASDNSGAGPTDSQRFTATYIVNVSGSQPAGTYSSTLTYICTPTF